MEKIESILKEENINNWSEEVSRSIQFPDYAWSIILSKVFLEAKNRFKRILKFNIKYTDGLTPQEIDSYLQNFEETKIFFWNDQSKYDR